MTAVSNVRSKILLVAALYAAALVATVAVVTAYHDYMANVSDPGSSGMQSFGDGAFTAGFFGLMHIGPTALALYYLRPVPAWWRILVRIAWGAALSSVLIVAGVKWGPRPFVGGAREVLGLAMLAQIFGGPLLAGGFTLAALFAPGRAMAINLIGAAGAQLLAVIAILFFAV